MSCFPNPKRRFLICLSGNCGPWLTLALGVVGDIRQSFLLSVLHPQGFLHCCKIRWSPVARSSGRPFLSTFLDWVSIHWWKSKLLRIQLFILNISWNDCNRNCTPRAMGIVAGGFQREGLGDQGPREAWANGDLLTDVYSKELPCLSAEQNERERPSLVGSLGQWSAVIFRLKLWSVMVSFLLSLASATPKVLVLKDIIEIS